jgi:phage tail sheath gpL-like
MTAPPVSIIGFASTDFVPGFVGETVLGAGPATSGNAVFKLHLVGNKLATGSKTANQDTDQVFDETMARAYYGPGSELHRMVRAALRIPGIQIWCTPVTESAGAAGTQTITFTGTATSAGSFIYWIDGERVEVSVALGDVPTTAGATLVSQVTQKDYLPCTSANASGTVTNTRKQKGTRGNFGVVVQDTTQAPSGMTSALGGAGTTVTGGGKRFGGGTTADDVTQVSTNVFPAWFQRVALAANDSANLGVWLASENAKAGPLEGRPEYTVVSSSDTLSNAQSLSQTTLNNGRFQLVWMLESESHPAEISAFVAALRTATEAADPGAAYDDAVLLGIVPSRFPAQSPQRSTKLAALQTGLTPVYTSNGQALITRSITTRCLNGTAPDYRVLDTGWASVTDFIRVDFGSSLWPAWKTANPVLRDDPAPEQGEPPSGVGTPKSWNGTMIKRLKEFERGTAVSSGIPQVIDVDLNLPSTGWDSVAKRPMSLCPVVPAPRNHQIGVSLRQM